MKVPVAKRVEPIVTIPLVVIILGSAIATGIFEGVEERGWAWASRLAPLPLAYLYVLYTKAKRRRMKRD